MSDDDIGSRWNPRLSLAWHWPGFALVFCGLCAAGVGAAASAVISVGVACIAQGAVAPVRNRVRQAPPTQERKNQ